MEKNKALSTIYSKPTINPILVFHSLENSLGSANTCFF